MANTKITSRVLADDAVLTANITDANVTTAKIAADAITGAKIADDAINSEHYTDGSIDTAHIADANVTTAKIADDAITTAKIADDVALGGNPTTTTQSAGNNTTRIATTAFVTTALASVSSALDDITAGDAAATLATTAGNITIDAQGSDTDIIFKGTDGSSDLTALTLDMSEAGAATFAGNVKSPRFILNGTDSATTRYIFTDNTNTGDGRLVIQSGGGSAGYGGAINLYSHSHSSKPGDVVAGISSNSNGEFRVNTSGIDNGSDVFVVKADGNVGIGVTSPASPLHIKTSTNHNLEFEETSGDVRISALNDARDANIRLEFAASDYEFYTGNVFMPNLYVADDIGHSGDSNTYMSFENDFLGFYTGGTGTLFMNTGKVAVGSTQVNVTNAILTVDGGDMMVHGANNSAGISDLLPGYTRGDYGVIYSTANNIYFAVGSSYISYIAGGSGQYTISDERMKENVTTLSGTLDKVKQLRGVSHTWKDTEEMGTDTQIGMIAQEVETVYPELVGDGGLPNDNEGNAPMKSVNYPHLTSVLVEAIKELSTKLEAAEARIKTLEDA